jgi:quercetin dioxygenase-like cupin family protein
LLKRTTLALLSAAVLLPAQEIFHHALPEMDGKNLQVHIVDVPYAPGETSKPHTHPCPVIGYVVSGSIRHQVKGEPEAVYHAGQTFYEPPNGIHLESSNDSKTEPAHLIAFFVCDHETPLTKRVQAK